MTLTKHFCDRCGHQIEADRVVLFAECGPLAMTRPETELCPACSTAFLSWLAAPKLAHAPVAAGPAEAA